MSSNLEPYRAAQLVALLILSQPLSSCSYYAVKPLLPADKNFYNQTSQSGNFIIVHSGKDVWHLDSVSVSDSLHTVSGTLKPLPPGHEYYKKAQPRKSNYYKHIPEQGPLFEVHLYTSEIPDLTQPLATLSTSRLYRAEKYEPDTGATRLAIGSLIVLGVAATLGLLLLIPGNS